MFTELLGRTIRKKFYVTGDRGEERYYRGKIVSFQKALTRRGTLTDITTFRVRYQDGDSEDLRFDEINKLLLRAQQLAHDEERTKDQIFTGLNERAHAWEFTHPNTRKDLLRVQHALTQVRYGAYYDNPDSSRIQGFLYNAGIVSKNKMQALLEHANWKPIHGQLHHDTAYSEMKSQGLLTEAGYPPIKRPTLLEYNAAMRTLEGPWWQ
jgi:hypothetical protein